MANLALRKRQRCRDFQGSESGLVRCDRALQGIQQSLQAQQERLSKFNQDAQRILGMNNHPLSRLLQRWPFRWIVAILPRCLRQPFEPFQDPNAFLEREARLHLNQAQGTVIDLAEVAQDIHEQTEKWQSDCLQAQQKPWKVEEIEDWLQECETALGFSLDKRVQYLIGLEIATLDKPSYEKRRQQGLEQMAQFVKTMQELREALQPVGISAIQSFNVSRWNYLGTATVGRPTSILNQTAWSLTELNKASLNASRIIQASLKQSLATIEQAVDAIDVVKQRMVASPETQKILADGRKKLMARLNLKEKDEEVQENDSKSA